MKFEDYEYKRPDLEAFQEKISRLLEKIGSDIPAEEESSAINRIFALNDEISSMGTLASIRNSLDTKDDFYQDEKDFFDENGPKLQAYENLFSKRLLTSKNREALEDEFGSLLFEQAELKQKTFSEEAIPDMQKENRLATRYSKLLAGAEIEFEGKTRNLSQMGPFLQSPDRDTRHKAQLAVSSFFSDHEEELDEIYGEMVKVRTRIAETLGYGNFVQLAYDRMRRLGYDADDVKTYRDQIYEHVVPVVDKLVKRKARRIGIDNPKSYDLALSFKTGNPTPKGDVDWQLNHAKTMYGEMSHETKAFFDFMVERNLLDLESKPGKRGGGYTTFIPKYDSPFIFANFNGTSHDVKVLTHEAGHAFQIFSARDNIPAYRLPTMEAAEIHSMSMEFLAWPWMDKFFEEDTEKYRFYHLDSSLSFLPYGVAVDEFQHEVYEKPGMTPDERKQTWRRIEQKYMPYKDYGDDSFLDKGTFWYRQGHIFSAPFYYIDYTLAQVLAFQFFVAGQDDHAAALKRYIKLCRLGGSKPFLDLVRSADLDNPFKKGTIKAVINPIQTFLDGIDDQSL